MKEKYITKFSIKRTEDGETFITACMDCNEEYEEAQRNIEVLRANFKARITHGLCPYHAEKRNKELDELET